MTLYSVVLFFLFALVNNQQFYLSQVLLCFFALTIIIGIFVLSEKQLSIVEKFFQAASHDDFSQKYNANDVSGTLANALNMITEKFKQSRVSEQTENSFLKTIIRQAPVAIIVFDQRERLTLFNHTASKLFSVKAPMVLADLASGFYELPELLRTLVGNHKVLYKMHRDGVDYSFKFSASHLLLANKTQTLVIIENIFVLYIVSILAP